MGSSTPVSVAIVGGGIGGMAAALSLLAAGFDAHVFERAEQLGEIGAGIQISPNAARILHRLGLGGALDAAGVRPLAWHQRRWDNGRTLLRTPLAGAVEAAFDAPHYQIHRAELLSVLAAALPPERLHVGHCFERSVPHAHHVEVHFTNGAQVEAGVLVGADGIHSAVRSALMGPDEPRYAGCVAYRGLVPAERLAALELPVEAEVWMGPGRHFVHYFVSRRRWINFVAVVDQKRWGRESWVERGQLDDALAAFEGWHPQVRAILQSSDELFVRALFDRPELPRWSFGRITLLGDACHAMLPFMAQGAAQAIEDGAALAACLAAEGHGRESTALRRYEALRLPRTSRVQAQSTANQLRFHLPDGAAQRERDAQMASSRTDWSLSATAWLYGHDAGHLEEG